jgi:hypothetical protein
MEPRTFPTLGAAVLYLNSFHHGSNRERLNFIAKHKPKWVMSIATSMWKGRDLDIAKDYPEALGFALKEVYVQTFNEQIQPEC